MDPLIQLWNFLFNQIFKKEAAKIPFSIRDHYFYGAAVAYGGMGLAGKITTNYTFGSLKEKDEETIDRGSGQGIDDLRKFDHSLALGGGLRWRSFNLGMTYRHGMANISPDSETGSDIRNRCFGITAGYFTVGSGKSIPGWGSRKELLMAHLRVKNLQRTNPVLKRRLRMKLRCFAWKDSGQTVLRPSWLKKRN